MVFILVEKVHFPRNYRPVLQQYRMPETAGKVPISEHLKNASAPSLAVDPCKNLVLGRQFSFADTERRKVRAVHQMVRTRARDVQHRGKLLGIQYATANTSPLYHKLVSICE